VDLSTAIQQGVVTGGRDPDLDHRRTPRRIVAQQRFDEASDELIEIDGTVEVFHPMAVLCGPRCGRTARTDGVARSGDG
jgi:hypothetical protein